jgi:superoxide dismutase, Fe-Mn family
MDRRTFIQHSTVGAAGIVLSSAMGSALAQTEPAAESLALAGPIMPDPETGLFTLPKLEFGYGDFEPYIDRKTMELHHMKHHQTYINNLNAALDKAPEWKGKPLEFLLQHLSQLPEEIRASVRNNGGGHYNHTLYWRVLMPARAQQPTMKFVDDCNANIGNFDYIRSFTIYNAEQHFGSGWAWVVKLPTGKISFTTTNNQDNPIMEGAEVIGTPILCIDLWEHAYYLKYKEDMNQYLYFFFNMVNWKTVESIFYNA